MNRRTTNVKRGAWWSGVFGVLVFGWLMTTAVAVYAATTVTTDTTTTTEGSVITANIPQVTLEVPIGTTGQVSGIAEYVQIFYRFAVSAVAIIAATMIMYAGISWLTAAGNSQRIGEAKERIIAAISGLIIAMLSFVILNTINPELTTLQNPTIQVSAVPTSLLDALTSTGSSGSTSGSSSGSTSGGNSGGSTVGGSCVADAGPVCEPSILEKTSGGCFGTHVSEASAICHAESGGQSIESVSDKCSDGNAFSVGLFQINMIANGSLVSGCDPKNIYTWGSGGSPPLNSDKKSYNCTVKDPTLYATCKAQFMDAATNIKTACKISNSGTKWSPWSTNNLCGF